MLDLYTELNVHCSGSSVHARIYDQHPSEPHETRKATSQPASRQKTPVGCGAIPSTQAWLENQRGVAGHNPARGNARTSAPFTGIARLQSVAPGGATEKDMKITMNWTPLPFGQHKGKTLPQLAFIDPDYFFWGMNDGVFDQYGLRQEAQVVRKRATHIRIPRRGEHAVVAEYGSDPSRGKFANVEVVPEDRPSHRGSTRTVRLPYFDLSVPRQFAKYDKSGCKLLVAALKVYLFGDPGYCLTKQRCEAFFENDSNFDL